MSKGSITLSQKELDRLSLIKTVTEGHVTQTALQLQLSVRQVKRLAQRYRQEGDQGLISKRCGKPSIDSVLK